MDQKKIQIDHRHQFSAFFIYDKEVVADFHGDDGNVSAIDTQMLFL